jgi:hypothetical protein
VVGYDKSLQEYLMRRRKNADLTQLLDQSKRDFYKRLDEQFRARWGGLGGSLKNPSWLTLAWLKTRYDYDLYFAWDMVGSQIDPVRLQLVELFNQAFPNWDWMSETRPIASNTRVELQSAVARIKGRTPANQQSSKNIVQQIRQPRKRAETRTTLARQSGQQTLPAGLSGDNVDYIGTAQTLISFLNSIDGINGDMITAIYGDDYEGQTIQVTASPMDILTYVFNDNAVFIQCYIAGTNRANRILTPPNTKQHIQVAKDYATLWLDVVNENQ